MPNTNVTTSIDVKLSAALQANSGYGLAQAGVYAYAVYFETAVTTPDAQYPTSQTPYAPSLDGGGPAVAANGQYTTYYYKLVDNGVIQNGGTTNVVLPTNNSTGNTELISGKLYLIIQSGQPNGDLFTGATPIIGQESDINWTNAVNNDFRFDSIELNVDNSQYDVANLTSVNGFGLPMTISNGLGDTRGYNIKAGTAADGTSSLFGLINDASTSGATTQNFTYSTGPLGGDQRMMLSPAESLAVQTSGSSAFTYTQWHTYVQSLQSQAAANKIVISNWFNGAPDANGIWHNAGFYSYQLNWDATNSVFLLKPTDSSAIKGTIRIAPVDDPTSGHYKGGLENSIYATTGDVDILKADGSLFQTINTGANNQWGNTLTPLLVGFTAGYLGATANSVNPLVTSSTIDLSKSWNWDPSYAFGNPNVTSGAGDVTPSASVFYDKYSQAFFANTNSYGGGYSDALMKAFPAGGPLMPLWNGTQDIAKLTVNLFADNETPGSYVTPKMYNYIAPNGGGYATLDNFFVGDSNNFTIALSVGTVAVKSDTAITLGFFDASMNGGAGGFHTVSLPNGESIYQSWTLQSDFTLSSAHTPITNSASVVFTGMPVMSDADLTAGKDIAWYQLTVGSGGTAKTFNIYAQVDPTTHQYVWTPNSQAMSATAQMDGLGFITGQTTNGPTAALTLNVAGASGVAIDSSYWAQITSSTLVGDTGNASFPTPWAPVIGSVDSSDTFTNLSGFTPFASTKANPTPGWVMPTAPTTKLGELAFGWNGSDTTYAPTNSTPDTSKVYGYTNKLGALNAAEVNFTQTDGGAVSGWVPTTATADLDGRWHTEGVQFGNGTFKVTMTEYQAADVDLATPVAKTSQFQSFTVSMDDLLLATADSGHALSLDNTGHSSTLGNWIRLTAGTSTLHNGTLIAYATNGSGQMLDHDGNVTSSLHDATLVKIGSVANDAGTTMVSGAQSVYLPVGEQMHFALVSSSGTVDSSPTVNITGTGGASSYTVDVSDGNGSLSLTAQVIAGNALTSDAVAAAAQRNTDTAWMYLTKGATYDVSAAWSSGYVNTLHFVKIDVDATTGAWSVYDPVNKTNVAYGDTDAFRTAVKNGWDSGYSASHGNGTGSDASPVSWTVAGNTGYYAPVLVNSNTNPSVNSGQNELFIINNGATTANADGHEHVRMYGENVFGLEDKSTGSDWDYNDMVVKVSLHS